MDAASATTLDGLTDPLSIPVRVRAFSNTALTRFRTCKGDEERPLADLDHEASSTFLLLSAKKRSGESTTGVVVVDIIRDEESRRETHLRIPKACTRTLPCCGFQYEEHAATDKRIKRDVTGVDARLRFRRGVQWCCLHDAMLVCDYG